MFTIANTTSPPGRSRRAPITIRMTPSRVASSTRIHIKNQHGEADVFQVNFKIHVIITIVVGQSSNYFNVVTPSFTINDY